MSRKRKFLILLLLYLLYLGPGLEHLPALTIPESLLPEQAVFPLALRYQAEMFQLLQSLGTPAMDQQPAVVLFSSGVPFSLQGLAPTFLSGRDLLYSLMSLRQ